MDESKFGYEYEDGQGITIIKKGNKSGVQKHGSHNQKTHGGKGGGGGEASVNAVRAVNDESFRESNDWSSEDNKKLTAAYKDQYTENSDENVSGEFEVENYATSGYYDINRAARGVEPSNPNIENKISVLDKTIEESPDMFGNTNLYRVTSDRLLTDLEPGDIFVDKGFMSTTRTNLTKNASARNALGEIGSGVDSVTVILPSPSRTGKGLAVDKFLTARGQDGSGQFWGKEKEVLLPRDTALLFLGMSTSTDHQGKPIAIFQRMDN
jgi:hypothetical protein